MLFSKSTGGFYDEAIHGSVMVHADVVDKDTGAISKTGRVPNPQCLIPPDAVAITAEQYQALLVAQSRGKIIQPDAKTGQPVAVDHPPPTAEQTQAQMAAAVQAYMDASARTRGYDSLLSAVSYADEAAVATFQAEGKAFRAWRSGVWATCYSVLAEVQAGKRAVPSAEQLIGLLPALKL